MIVAAGPGMEAEAAADIIQARNRMMAHAAFRILPVPSSLTSTILPGPVCGACWQVNQSLKWSPMARMAGRRWRSAGDSGQTWR